MKRRISILLVFTLVFSMVLAGCGKKNEPAGDMGDVTKVGLVVAGGLGDRSFYDSSHEGVEKAKEDLGIEYKVYECRNDASLFNDQLVQASEYASIVAVVGFEFYDVVQEIAKEFPEVYYIYVDNEIEGIDNLITISYAENEGSFLAGALAAMLTESKIIGMVGGMDIPVIRNFQVGYEAGAKYIDPDVEVETIFAEDFEDPAKGKEAATALYSRGADIVFQVAGKTGEGVFEAAEELGKYAIGVDTDQRYINPDVIVASMVKKVGLSIYDTIENILKGEVNSGKVIYYGLEQDGVGIGYGTEDMKQFVTDEMKAQLDEIKDKIVKGEIEVPEGK
ncbi:MAG: BMP family ABC transporter substrate-binding protein [Tissierellia bacterium]|jgi:basic membrane protein A|nr:BMP family ABC transporter substrate-binding protein [Tissierellia bacterium]